MCQIPLKILLIEDSRADALLMCEYLNETSILFEIEIQNDLKEICSHLPECSLILIGSGVLLHQGITEFYRMTDNLDKDIPVILLLEFEDEEKHLITRPVKNLYCLPRPKCDTEVPEMIREILSFNSKPMEREA